MDTRHLFMGIAAAALATVVAACGGGGSSSASSTPTSPGGGTTSGAAGPVGATITISGNAVSPKSVTISVGQSVMFVNNDSRAHDIASDPHPIHTDCPDINIVGFLQAGQSRATNALTVARSCGFHDHDNPDTTSLQGTIVIH